MSHPVTLKSIRRIALAFILAISLTHCAKPSESESTPPPPPVHAPAVQVDASGWEIHERTSADGTVKFKQTDMPVAAREKAKQEYRQTSLIPIPADPKFNVSLFRIDNVKDWESTLFIAPRLYAYGSAQGGRVAPERHADGTVSISFPVVLIDGTSTVIDSPTSGVQVNVPQSMLIADLAGLRADIGTRFGKAMTLSPLPGCPKKLILKINDQEHDVTPSDLETADYCQANKPFNVTVRLPEQDARYMLEEALYANAVEVRATFETRVNFISSRASVSFDKSKIFKDIEAELAVHAGAYADVDAHLKMTDIVKNQALNIQIQGDVGPIVQSVVDQAIKEFFEPFNPDPDTRQKACSDAIVCLRLNYNSSHQTGTFDFNWTQTTTALTGQNYITWAQLTPLLDKEIVIGDGFNTGGDRRPELSSTVEKGFETGLTAVPGDLLVITPSYLIEEQRSYGLPTTSTIHKPVCLAGVPAHDHEVCRTVFHHGENDTECHTEHVPEVCTQSEDQWVTTTLYSMSAPQFSRIDQPIGQMEKIFDGLALRFVWRTPGDGKEKETICPLNQFSRQGDGKSIIVHIENRGTCDVFTQDPTVQPMIYLVNKIDFPVTYKDGAEVHLWNGQNPQNPVLKTYHPEVRFAGKVAIRGYSFGSGLSGGQRVP